MDLSHPARDLIGDAAARILHRLSLVSEGLTGRRIAALAELPTSSTNRALEKLEAVGLVRALPAGNAKLYRLNRGHVLWPPVEQMLTAPARVEELAATLVHEALADRASVAVYGSMARGEAGPESDVDLLVVWLDDVPSVIRERLLRELDERLSDATGNRVEIVDVDREDLERLSRAEDPLAQSWRQDARTLWGLDIRTILKEHAR